MKRHVRELSFIAAIIILAGCGTIETSPSAPAEGGLITTSEVSEALPPGEPPEYEITITTQAENEIAADIRVLNLTDGQESLFLTLENVDENHYHAAEYHTDTLYIIRQWGSSEEGWMQELWKYDTDGSGVKIYASDSIDFRVAPDQSLIAVVLRGSGDIGEDQLIFLDPEGNQAEIFSPEIGNLYLDLGKWSRDSRLFWGTYQAAYRPLHFYRVEIDTWQYTPYDLSGLSLEHEYALNPETGQLLYSDFPVFFEVTGYHRFLIQQDPVTLYLYDFSEQSQRTISIIISKSFNPEWIDDEVIEYRDPNGLGRIRHDLSVSTTTLIPVEKEIIEISPRIMPPGFETVLESLTSTGISPVLPLEFPTEDGLPPVVPYLTRAEYGSYVISLDYGEDCHGAGACHYGSLAARKIDAGGGAEATILPILGTSSFIPLQLAHNIPGYFVESQCGANCSDAQISWIYDGTEYLLGLKAGSMEDVVALANAALENSLPSAE